MIASFKLFALLAVLSSNYHFALSKDIESKPSKAAVPSLDLGLRELNAAGISAAELYDSLFDAALALGDDCGSAINQAAKLYIDD